MAIEIGKTPVLKMVRGVQLIYGRHDLLSKAFAEDLPVWVRDEDGQNWFMRIEYVGRPNSDDYTWAHPLGTRSPEQPPVEIETRQPRTRRPRVRRHT